MLLPEALSLLGAIIECLLYIQGLITEERESIDPDALPFARKVKEASRQGLREGASLVDVVRKTFTLDRIIVVVNCSNISIFILYRSQ